MKKLTPDTVKKILSDVQSEKAFWVNNGPVLKNINEFASSIKKMKSKQFIHHVNRDRNDFAKWVDEVVGDRILAQRIKLLKTKQSTAKAVSQRIAALRQFIK